VVLEPQEGGGFTVLVPALPEVVTEGDTEEGALANAHEAIPAALLQARSRHRYSTTFSGIVRAFTAR
jgi:antitoxin HicB